MFAATQDTDGTFRLSIRRIRTIRTHHDRDGNPKQILFSSRAKAKACADRLNSETNYEDVYDKYTGKPLSGVFGDTEYNTMCNVLDIVREYML